MHCKPLQSLYACGDTLRTVNVDRFRVRHNDRKALTRHETDDTGQFKDKDAAHAHLQKGLKRLEERQELLYAQDRYALLLIFQGMDGRGRITSSGT